MTIYYDYDYENYGEKNPYMTTTERENMLTEMMVNTFKVYEIYLDICIYFYIYLFLYLYW